MKKILLLITITTLIFSCSKESTTEAIDLSGSVWLGEVEYMVSPISTYTSKEILTITFNDAPNLIFEGDDYHDNVFDHNFKWSGTYVGTHPNFTLIDLGSNFNCDIEIENNTFILEYKVTTTQTIDVTFTKQ